MKKSLVLLSFIVIAAFSLVACNNIALENAYENSEFGLSLEYPNGWSVVYESDSTLDIQSDSDEDQMIKVNKFKRTNDETDIWAWYEESDFPGPATDYEERVVDGLPALKNVELNSYLILDDNKYYSISACSSLSCEPVDTSVVLEVVDSIEFTD